MTPVWIIDDDRSIRWVLEKALARENIEFKSFATADDALRALESGPPQVVVSDIRMPGSSGLDFLQALHQRHPLIPAIIMTAYSDLESAVSAFQGGAFEYLPKPFDVNHAVELIRRALEQSQRKSGETQEIEAAADILGQAPAMQEVFRAIGKLAQSQATVLINGESGTGKELVARALHRHSPRAGKPFIAINTAAIPKDLLESELFGHERGAFTGAQSTRRGRFEQADGGTLFLDEIGDMPFDLQTRLLRVLSDGQFYRVGGHQPLKANVRVIAATHQDLEQRVREGAFREDLYHRLNVIRLRLPALRERLAAFDYPGNVRQLENICHWLTVMAPSQVIEADDLPSELRPSAAAASTSAAAAAATAVPSAALAGASAAAQPTASAAGGWLPDLHREARRLLEAGSAEVWDTLARQFEGELIHAALELTRGRRIEAAHKLGIGRNTITRKIQQLGLDE